MVGHWFPTSASLTFYALYVLVEIAGFTMKLFDAFIQINDCFALEKNSLSIFNSKAIRDYKIFRSYAFG